MIQYTPGVFIDLPKVFNAIYHSVLLRKLELSGAIGINKVWFKSYLSQTKQYIQVEAVIEQTFNL